MQNRIKSQTQENNNASTLCYLHRMHLFLEIPKIICNSITHSCKNLNHVLDMTHFYIFRVHFYTKIATFQFLHLAFIFGNSKKDLIALIATELIILQKNMKCIYVMTNLYIFICIITIPISTVSQQFNTSWKFQNSIQSYYIVDDS